MWLNPTDHIRPNTCHAIPSHRVVIRLNQDIFPAAKQRFKGTLTRHNILEPTKLSISTFYQIGQSHLEIILRYQCPFTVMVP